MKKLLKTIREFFARLFGKKKVELSLVPQEPVVPTLTEVVESKSAPKASPKAPKNFSEFWKKEGDKMIKRDISIKKVKNETNTASGNIASIQEINEACSEKGIKNRRANMKEIAKIAWETSPKTK